MQTINHFVNFNLAMDDYLRNENAEGYVLITVYLFIYLYACYSHN